jgi:hypothetical protein
MDTKNRNRNHVPEDPLNPTNDVKINTLISVNRMTVTALELATLELPRVQRLIEPEWSKLYTYEGFSVSLPHTNILQVKDCCHTYTATMPYSFNSIVEIDMSDPTSPIFTTSGDHNLTSNCVKYWLRDPIRIIGLSSVIEITEMTHFTVLSPTTFQIFDIEDMTWNINTEVDVFGQLYFPPLATPDNVALLLTDKLNESFVQNTQAMKKCPVFKIQFDKYNSKFCIFMTVTALQNKDIDFIKTAILKTNSFVQLLGFGGFNQQFQAQTEPWKILAGCAPFGTTVAVIPSGNYGSSHLAQELTNICGSVFFAPVPIHLTKSSDFVNDTYFFSIGTNIGNTQKIFLPPGGYTPYTLAETVTELLSTAWPEGQIDLTWNTQDEVFCFHSLLSFSLEFQTLDLTNIAAKFGFGNFRYAGKNSYCSDILVNVRSLNYKYQTTFEKFSSCICTVNDNPTSRKFTFNFSGQPPLPVTGTRITENEDGTIYIENTQQAHGFQIDDVVQVKLMGETFMFSVLNVISGTIFQVSLGSVVLPKYKIDTTGKIITSNPELTSVTIDIGVSENDFMENDQLLFSCDNLSYIGTVTDVTMTHLTFDISPNTLHADCLGVVTEDHEIAVCGLIIVEHTKIPSTSLLMGCDANPCAIKPWILGFGCEDILWNCSSTITSPFVYKLRASTYILLELVYPCGSARIEHRSFGDNKTTILGKIVTLKDPYLERFYPMKATFFTGIKLTYCHFRLLNPDHSLYKLHGHDWQATFRLHSPRSIQ